MNNYVTFLFVFFFCLRGYSLGITEADSLILEVSTNKQEYFIYEPIYFHVYIKNLAKEGPRLETNLHQNICLKNSKDNMRITSNHSDYFRPDNTMALNDTFRLDFDLLRIFSVYHQTQDYSHWTNYFPPDIYKVKYSFYSKHNKYIESDELSFVVKNVSGDEIQSLFLLKNCFSKYDSTEQFNYVFLDKLIEEHPNSVYTDYAISYILRKLRFKNDTLDIEIKKKYSTQLIEKYPESKYVPLAVSYLVEYYKSKNQLNTLEKYLDDQKKNIKCPKTLKMIHTIQRNISKTVM